MAVQSTPLLAPKRLQRYSMLGACCRVPVSPVVALTRGIPSLDQGYYYCSQTKFFQTKFFSISPSRVNVTSYFYVPLQNSTRDHSVMMIFRALRFIE